ncbi:flavin reductase family protein [Phyllobacterium sp. 628]|uniref:flavin reductase family protein n=1 Tax=Phyllobacterium sp. 628 TaxID=2718938 RepID=UPI0016624A36|nr:flavin reductase family protein [Phyllobacterium sp. 628]QND51397.1 flavin reductase family protein [Phyllobacterium sp. 628]
MSIPQPTFHVQDHITITPSVLYFGTPVVLVTTRNEDGSSNITPMSSAWSLGDRVVLGLASTGQGCINLLRERECVLNFACAGLSPNVERIAKATGCNPVPDYKAKIGYHYVADKFALGGFTPIASELVAAPRISECPMQIEAKVVAVHGSQGAAQAGPHPGWFIVETQALRVHAHQQIVVPKTQHIDTDEWHPLFYIFRHYFSTGPDLGRNFRAEH